MHVYPAESRVKCEQELSQTHLLVLEAGLSFNQLWVGRCWEDWEGALEAKSPRDFFFYKVKKVE